MAQGSGRSNVAAHASGYLLAEIIQGLARATAMTVEVFLHSDFGHYYIGCGAVGMVVIFLFTGFFPDQNPRPMFLLMAAYGVRWLFLAIGAMIRYWRGKNLVHSRYTGRPYLWALLPTWKEVNVKHLEAAAVIVLGFGFHYLNRPLGYYLMIAATLVLLRGYHLDTEQRDRAVELNDCVIEQTLVAERFRDMQGR